MSYGTGVGQELVKELAEKVIVHRNQFRNQFIGRYLEGLSALFFYDIPRPFNRTRLEILLRSGYGVVFGKNSLGIPSILGTVQDIYDYNSIMQNLHYQPYHKNDINFVVADEFIPKGDMLEITADDPHHGNFVVFHNKPVNFTNDRKIIENYADILAEIEASRFSLVMQAKIMTVFPSYPNDESVNQLVTNLYNGVPFLKVSNQFDVVDNIIHIDNSDLAQNLQETKSEYQNRIAELNASFGVNVLAVDKASGVTESEANGNLSYVNMNQNIWLVARQLTLDLYNVRYGTNWHVKTAPNNTDLIVAKGGESNENNDNTGGNNQDGGEEKSKV